MAWYDQPAPGRNALCLCGSGRKMKRCCRNFYEFAPIPRERIEGTFLSHEMLWFGEHVTPDGLAGRLAPLPGPWIARVLAILQWMIGDDLWSRDNTRELGFLREFARRPLVNKAEAWLATGRAQTVFHRCTVLALLQARLLAPARAPIDADAAAIADVAEFAIMANDLLEKDYAAITGETATTGGVDKALAASFFRNGFLSHRAHWGAATARNWGLLGQGMQAVSQKFPLEAFDVSGAFLEQVGVTPTAAHAVVTSVVSHYQALSRADFNAHPERFMIGSRFFQLLGNERMTASGVAVLRWLSASWDEHVELMHENARGPSTNAQQFFSLYNKPLMREGDAHFPLDLEFLRSQTTEGWYWLLVRLLSRAGSQSEVRRLHASYGRAFEWYCSDIVRSTARANAGIKVWLDWEGHLRAPAGQKVPDAIIRDGNMVFVVEMTASAVPPQVAISCDPVQIERALENVWFGSSPKLPQLLNAWEGVQRGAVTADGLALSEDDVVAPLFVTLRYTPLHLAMWHWYRDIMMANGLPRAFVEKVRFMDVEDWEEFCAAGLQGSMRDAFCDWQESKWRWVGFEDWRSATVGGRAIHPRVGEHLDDYWQAITTELGVTPPT